MKIIDLEGLPLLEQLRLEEALLRADDEEYCLVNQGASPAIVMGISGNPSALINEALLKKRPLPVIKRYSGGGTVVVDSNTFFVTFICNSPQRQISPFPKEIMQWSENVYAPFFANGFHLRENDYVIGERKCGGNAQYIQKQRWVHHTTFLWDFDVNKMEYLLLPEKRPAYRSSRPHSEFLCKLREFFPDRDPIFQALKSYLKTFFSAEETSVKQSLKVLNRPHRKSTTLIA